MSGRWSRAAASRRWAELGDLVERPLVAGLACSALWPVSYVVARWAEYRDPVATTVMLVVSIGLPLLLCRMGRRGIGPWTSALAILSSIALTLLVGRQVAVPDPEAGNWMNAWGVAVVVVLVFARPVEEPLLAMVGVTVVNLALAPTGDPQAVHIAPMPVGAAVPATICAIGLASVLRTSVRASRATRAEADAAEQRRAIADAVHSDRRRRFAEWDATAAPLLEDIATGRRDPTDPAVGEECARLAAGLRSQLADRPESVFEALLRDDITRAQERGGALTVDDLGAGDRLDPSDRILVVDLIREASADDGPGIIALTLLDSDVGAVVLLDVEGTPIPAGPAWTRAAGLGTTTSESPTRWWWDAELRGAPTAQSSGR